MSKLYVDAHRRGVMASTMLRIAALLTLIIFLTYAPEVAVATTTIQSNVILVHGSHMEWHYVASTDYKVKPLSLTILLVPKRGIVELYYNSSAGSPIHATLRYYIRTRGKVIEIDILSDVLSHRLESNITVRESSVSKIVIANRSIEVLLYSYEIEVYGSTFPPSTPIERDISEELLTKAHELGYKYITNLFGIFKSSISTRGSKYSYDVFDVDIDTGSYLRSLPSELRMLCRFINASSLFLNVTNMFVFHTSPTTLPTATHNLIESSLDVERTLCLLPLVLSLNKIVLSLRIIPSIPKSITLPQIESAVPKVVSENIAVITALHRDLRNILNTTDYALLYTMRIWDVYLAVDCSITHKLGKAVKEITVTRVFSIVQSYVAKLPLLGMDRNVVSTISPYGAYIRYESSDNLGSHLFTAALPTSPPPKTLNLIVAITVLLVAIQVIVILYYIIKAIKKR